MVFTTIVVYVVVGAHLFIVNACRLRPIEACRNRVHIPPSPPSPLWQANAFTAQNRTPLTKMCFATQFDAAIFSRPGGHPNSGLAVTSKNRPIDRARPRALADSRDSNLNRCGLLLRRWPRFVTMRQRKPPRPSPPPSLLHLNLNRLRPRHHVTLHRHRQLRHI
jgi:hypothetical protein